MADFATKTGTSGTVIPNTIDTTPAMTDRVPITGGRETSIANMVVAMVDDMSTALTADTTAMASIGGAARFTPAGTGAAERTIASRLQEVYYLKDFPGLDPTGVNDCGAAIQTAIDAIPNGGTLIVNGKFRSAQALNVTKVLTIQGQDTRNANVPDYTLSQSSFIFQGDVNGINATSVQLTLRNFNIMTFFEGSTTSRGVNQFEGSLITEGFCSQGFHIAARIEEAYYCKFGHGTRLIGNYGLIADYCFNVALFGTAIQAANYGIAALDRSSVSVFGGAIENYTVAGVLLDGDSSCFLYGAYFEGTDQPNSICIYISSGRNIVASYNSHVYLTTSRNFIRALENGARVYVRGTRFGLPVSPATTAVEVYFPKSGDATAVWDIDGDDWPASGVGSGVQYVAAGSVAQGVGDIRIRNPKGHVNYGVFDYHTAHSTVGSFAELIVDTAPAAPASGRARLYIEDVAGKLALKVRFPTGAAQQIAIEP